MKTHIKYPDLHFLQFAKSTVLIIFISLWITPAKAQLGGGGLDENTPYDLSDFKPLTAEKFFETDFPFIKRAYDKFPNILVKGYEIEIIPNKRPGFRPSVSTHQIYGHLVDKSALEWAIKNNYTVYLDNGYKIVKKLDNGTKISVNIATGRWDPNPKKTIEEDFRIQHNRPKYTFSKLHNILSAETANSIELQRTKYGEIYGEVSDGNNDANLQPLKDMMVSLLDFCDHKISKVRSLFLEKLNSK